jgi:hypothetical protein
VFLGERDNADPATNKVLQKYINNEDMGGLIKPKGVIVVSDSNELDHRSGAVQQSLALLSRSRMIEVRVDPDVYLKHFNEIGLNPYIQAYLSLRKEHVSTFDEVIKNRKYEVWANPRAWERLAMSMDDAGQGAARPLTHDEIIGDVGEGVGREFIGFLHAARELVSYDDIVKKPKKAAMPDKLSDMYAIVAMLAHSVKPEDFEAVRTYIERFSTEVHVLFLRLLMTHAGPRTARSPSRKHQGVHQLVRQRRAAQRGDRLKLVSAHIYADLCVAWERRMQHIAAGELNEATQVWGDAFHKYYANQPAMIHWDGNNCCVAGVMYFECTAVPPSDLVRVPK